MTAHGISLIHFKEELSVHAEVLGTRWPIRFGSTRAELCLPRLVGGTGGQRDFLLAAPKVRGVDHLMRWLADPDEPDRTSWGFPYSWGPGEDSSTVVSTIEHAVLRTPFPANSSQAERAEIAGQVERVADHWCGQFSYWLALRSCLRLEPTSHGIHVIGGGDSYTSTAWLHPTEEGWQRLPLQQRPILLEMTSDPSASPEAHNLDDWRQAARAATKTTEVPAEWRLLQSAFRASFDSHNRVAVLDAATAVELVLSDLVRAELEPTNPPATVKAIEARLRMLGEKLKFLSACGTSLPSKLQPQLVDLRNSVIHRNHEATTNETKVALNLARTVVVQHSPLPVP